VSGSIDDDLILFPEEAEFKKIPNVKGRIYMLEFKSSNKKLFYWMQEPTEDHDEYCKKINAIINDRNPQASISPSGSSKKKLNFTALENFGRQLGLDEIELRSYLDQLRSQEGDIEQQSMDAENEEDIPSLSDDELSSMVTPENANLLFEIEEIRSDYLSFITDTSSKSRDEWENLLRMPQFLEVS
jgi:hypothetical protein